MDGLTLQNSHPLLLVPTPFGQASCHLPSHVPFSIQISNVLVPSPTSARLLSKALTRERNQAKGPGREQG
jgi:hypothetical protein